jgi:hypothetical protein
METVETSESASSGADELSLDQIIDSALDADSDGSDTGHAPADDAAPPTTPETDEAKLAEAKTPAKEPKPDLDERFAENSIPENWKSALKAIKAVDSQVGKQIQVEHYQLAQYKELLPLEEAREMRTMFTSLDEARQAQKATADVAALSCALRTEPGKFVDFIRANEPEAYEKLTSEFPRVLFDSDPVVYKDTFAKPIVGTFLSHWERVAQESGNEYLAEAVKALREADEHWEKSNTLPPQDPRLRRLEEYESRDRQAADEGLRSFIADVDRGFVSSLRDQAEKMVERAGASGLTRDARKIVVEKATTEVYNRLRSDQYTRNQVGFSARGGNRDANHQQQIVEYLAAKAKPLISQKVKETLAWMADQVVGQNLTVRDKERRVASQKPVTAGVPTGSDKSSLDWSKMTDAEKRRLDPDEILSLAAAGRLA